jgi:hypothetical protein
MSDKDHVFARLGPAKPSSGNRRETLSIPRKGNGVGGSRVVEVVHLRPGTAGPAGKEPPRRPRFSGHAETWEHGFPTRSAALPPAEPPPGGPQRAEAAEPIAHVMPMWEPAPAPEPVPAAPEAEAHAAPRQRRGPGAPARRRVADPFNAADDAANCLRCGYVVEAARERRGLMTCAACG